MEKTFRIKREFGYAWLDWLRYGNFKQGYNYLHTAEEEFCCLGGLCEVVNEHIDSPIYVEQGSATDSDTLVYFYGAADMNVDDEMLTGLAPKSSIVLPVEIVKAAGITDMYGHGTGNPWLGPHRASEWNDDYGANFSVIAELVEMFGEFY